jgi:hypothetical protein
MTNLTQSFLMYLFNVSTCFEQQVLISFLLTGTSDSHPPECVIPDDVLTQFGPPDDEHSLLETCRGMK